jgi:hypothetical protein
MISQETIKKKYAVCMWGQLRAVDTIIDNFNKFLIEPLQADLYIFVQKTNTNIDSNLELFKTDNKILYDPSDNTKTFRNYDRLFKNNNYLNIPYLNVYENWYKINEKFGDIFEKNYNYIILTRSDFLHLFDFPDFLNIYDNNELFWCYDGHEYEGINTTLVCVSSKYIKEYLCCAYNYLDDPKNIDTLNNNDLNTERFLKLIFDKNNWKIGKIQNNAFITASSLNDITTWASISYCNINKVFYKYDYQMKNVYNSLEQYNNHKRWIISSKDINKIILETNNDNKIILETNNNLKKNYKSFLLKKNYS